MYYVLRQKQWNIWKNGNSKYFGELYFKNKSFSKKLYNRIHVGIYDAKKPHSFKYSAIKPGGLKKLHYPIFYKFWTHVVLGENY